MLIPLLNKLNVENLGDTMKFFPLCKRTNNHYVECLLEGKAILNSQPLQFNKGLIISKANFKIDDPG